MHSDGKFFLYYVFVFVFIMSIKVDFPLAS